MRLLIVEDETSIARGLAFNFEQEGYAVTLAADGPTALTQFEAAATSPDSQPFDCVVLDLMLPGMSGYAICERIRVQDPDVPILVLSARTLAEDKARAFDAGCDQYLTKPFALEELLSRVRNLINRRSPRVATEESSDLLVLGDRTIDFKRHQIATAEGPPIELTKMELALLRYFHKQPGMVLSREAISRDVWGQAADVSSRSIDNFVLRLRKLLEPDPAQPRHLISVRGTGYRFNPDP